MLNRKASVGTARVSWRWKAKVAVLLVVKSQLQLGVGRNPQLFPISVAAEFEISVGSLTSTEDCGWQVTLA